MYDAFGPTQPWLGLVDAVGVALAFLVWNAVRDAGARARAVVSAAGAALLAYALARSAGGVHQAASDIGVRGVGDWAAQEVAGHVLLVAGVAAGVYAVLALRRRAAEGAAPDDADDDPYAPARRRLAQAAPWGDVLAVALAIGLPVLPSGLHGGGFDPPRARITAAAVALHVLNGLLSAGALLVLTGRDDRAGAADARWVGAAFAVVAAGTVVRVAWPEAAGAYYWSFLGVGLVAGLMAAAALALLARAVPADRAALAAGVLAAVALAALASGLAARTVTDSSRQELGDVDFSSGFPAP